MHQAYINPLHVMTLDYRGYTITGILGSGMFGVVYRAFDSKTQKEYAVKAVPLRSMCNPRMPVLAEYEICSRLLRARFQDGGVSTPVNPENVVQMHEVFYDHENYYVAMECLRGQTVSSLIRNDYPNGLSALGGNVVKMCAWSVLSGIRYLKQFNIVHRDIKPSNVFVCARGPQDTVVKLIDMGLGTIVPDYKTSSMSSYVCTPFYALPEIEDNLPYTSRCDLWSAGMTIYYMATGRNLVSEKSPSYREDKKRVRTECRFERYIFPGIEDEGLCRILRLLLAPGTKDVEDIMRDPWFDGCTVPTPKKTNTTNASTTQTQDKHKSNTNSKETMLSLPPQLPLLLM